MAAVVARCRNDHIEPPAPAKVQRLVGRAVTDFEAQFCRSRVERISYATRSRLEDLVVGSGDETGEGAAGAGEGAVAGGGRSHFAELKTDPGAPALESLLAEVNKLERVRWLELPADLFADVSEKLVEAWRARASKEYPANLERMKPARRLTLLAALCHVRQTEITDSLVDLFIQLVLKINTRAERKVDKELNAELKKIRGKEGMLLRVADAALSEPSGTVRRVIYPVVGGEKTLKALAAEPPSGQTPGGRLHLAAACPGRRDGDGGPVGASGCPPWLSAAGAACALVLDHLPAAGALRPLRDPDAPELDEDDDGGEG
jgi:hypothetical protein